MHGKQPTRMARIHTGTGFRVNGRTRRALRQDVGHRAPKKTSLKNRSQEEAFMTPTLTIQYGCLYVGAKVRSQKIKTENEIVARRNSVAWGRVRVVKAETGA